MKLISLLALLILVSMPLALAQETAEVQNLIYPDSFLWKTFDRPMEKVKIWFTYIPKIGGGASKRSELKLLNIQERNQEMDVMLSENKPNSFELAQKKQKEDADSIKLDIVELTEEQANIINNGLNKSTERLKLLLEKHPDSKGLQNALAVHEELIIAITKIQETERVRIETGKFRE